MNAPLDRSSRLRSRGNTPSGSHHGPLRSRRTLATLTTAVTLALALIGAAAAQPPHTTTRLTFYASSAILAGSIQGLTPSLTGEYINPATGQRYSTYDAPSAGGHGYTQVDIVYADEQVCVGSVTVFGLDLLSNALTTLTTGGFVTPSDACADYWVAPAKLDQNQAFITPGLTVTRGQIQLRNGASVEVVGHRTMGSGYLSQSTYELATGYLLIGSTAVEGGAIPTLGPGNVVTPGSGGSTLTFTELLNVRQYQLPTASAVLPDHVRSVRELTYSCASGTRLGDAVSELACDARFGVTASAPQWLSFTSVTRLHNPVIGTSDVSEGTAVVTMAVAGGGLFVAPEVLRGLRPQQEIDLDPITNARTVVQEVTDRTVTMAVFNSAENSWFVYDRASGWLLESYQEKVLGMGSTYVRLQLVGVD